MRPHSVGCVPTYSAGRQSIAVRPAAVAVIRRFLILTGCSFDKAKLQETMVAGATLRPGDDAFTLEGASKNDAFSM